MEPIGKRRFFSGQGEGNDRARATSATIINYASFFFFLFWIFQMDLAYPVIYFLSCSLLRSLSGFLSFQGNSFVDLSFITVYQCFSLHLLFVERREIRIFLENLKRIYSISFNSFSRILISDFLYEKRL